MRPITCLVAVLAITPFTTAAGQFTPGDLVHVAVGQRPDLTWKAGRFVEVDGEALVSGIWKCSYPTGPPSQRFK